MEIDSISGVEVRGMRLTDILPLYRLHMSLSQPDRRFYHPFAFSSCSVLLYLTVFYATSNLGRLARAIVPRMSFRAIVALDSAKSGYAGFAYLQVPKSRPASGRFASLGIVVAAGYRGRNVSKALMQGLISLARKLDIERIDLAVARDNTSAIGLYKQFGFETVGSGLDMWAGEKLPYFTMRLTFGRVNKQ